MLLSLECLGRPEKKQIMSDFSNIFFVVYERLDYRIVCQPSYNEHYHRLFMSYHLFHKNSHVIPFLSSISLISCFYSLSLVP